MKNFVFFILWLILVCVCFTLIHRYNTLQKRIGTVEPLVLEHEAYFQRMYDLVKEW